MKREKVCIYNEQIKRLEYYNYEGNGPVFWDKHWNSEDLKKKIVLRKNRFLNFVLRKYTKNKHVKILEAGCGIGQFVYFMTYHGYDVYGIDSAKDTIERITKNYPELKIYFGDIRQLKFDDDFFDLYLSFGVIEHYQKGYNDILKEAVRVVKPSGYLIFSFPYLSFLRKLKIILGKYKDNKLDENLKFYQYALELKEFIRIASEFKLKPIKKIKNRGLKGFKDEVNLFKSMLQKLYDYNGRNKGINGIRLLLNVILSYFTSHTITVVLKNEK